MKILQLSTLEEALNSLEALATDELTFNVGDIAVTLRALMPHEEIAIQKYAQAAVTAGEEDNSTVMEYLDRYKWGIVSYAIIQIGTLDFRDVEFVETGEVLENGTRVKKSKVDAVRAFIQKKWGRVILNGIFKKYGELAAKIENKTEKLIEFEPSDLGTEIERTEARVAELKQQKEEEAKGKKDATITDQLRAIDELERSLSETDLAAREAQINEDFAASTELGSEAVEVIEETTPPPPTNTPVIPTYAPAPLPATQVVSRPPISQPQSIHQPPSFDSFADLSDPDRAAALMEAETQRILLARQRAALERDTEPPPEIEPTDPGELFEAQTAGSMIPPPHLSAQAASENLYRMHTVLPEVDGIPVYQMSPTESLEKVRQPMPSPTPTQINAPLAGTKNPRFQPPKKGY